MSRLRLPCTLTVLTRSTLTLKICSIADLIWCLLARVSTSNVYCALAVCPTDFSVTTGRTTTRLDSGTAHLRQRLVRVFRDEHAIVREQGVNRRLGMTDDGRPREVPPRQRDFARAIVARSIDDEEHARRILS